MHSKDLHYVSLGPISCQDDSGIRKDGNCCASPLAKASQFAIDEMILGRTGLRSGESMEEKHRVVILGGGFGGLAAAQN